MGYRTPAAARPRIILLEKLPSRPAGKTSPYDMPRCGQFIWSPCTGVVVDGVTVDNDLTMANTDALDIDSCQQVHIANSYFSAADDAICLKTTDKPERIQRPLRQVTIVNCTLRSKKLRL